MTKGRFGLNLSGGAVEVVDQLLKLGIEDKVRIMVLAPTKPSEPLQVTCYADRGQAKVRLIPDQRRLRIPIRTRIKLMAGMTISRKDIEQSGRIAVWNSNGRDVVISATATPTKYGEVIILVF